MARSRVLPLSDTEFPVPPSYIAMQGSKGDIAGMVLDVSERYSTSQGRDLQ